MRLGRGLLSAFLASLPKKSNRLTSGLHAKSQNGNIQLVQMPKPRGHDPNPSMEAHKDALKTHLNKASKLIYD